MKIGFIGLGNVGGKLAGSLLRNNFDVTVRDIDEGLTNSFKKLGAKIAKSPKELAEKYDLIITSLPSPEVSAKVMESEVDLAKRNASLPDASTSVIDDISYIPLHHQVISFASDKKLNVPIRPNNETLFRFSSKN